MNDAPLIAVYKQLIVLLQKQVNELLAIRERQVPKPPAEIDPSIPRLKIWEAAVKKLGTDASPNDYAPDPLACAETVWTIVDGEFHDFPTKGGYIISTIVLNQECRAHPKFKGVLDPEPGDIIIAVTATGNGTIYHGHTGIFYDKEWIMSNRSKDGKFVKTHTLKQFIEYYRIQGGMKIFIYRRIAL